MLPSIVLLRDFAGRKRGALPSNAGEENAASGLQPGVSMLGQRQQDVGVPGAVQAQRLVELQVARAHIHAR